MMNDKNVASIHWSFWAIGVVALIWNEMGIMSFFMQMNTDMLASLPEATRAMIEGRPAWITGAFAIAVFGGTLGCLMLLLKKSVAFYLFIASLLGTIVQIAPSLEIDTVGPLIGVGSSLVVVAFLIWYSKWVQSKGWIS